MTKLKKYYRVTISDKGNRYGVCYLTINAESSVEARKKAEQMIDPAYRNAKVIEVEEE